MKFQFDYVGLRYDKLAAWCESTVEVEGQWRRVGLETTWLHGFVRSGGVERGDRVAVPSQSGRVFLSTVVDFMMTLTDQGDFGWYSKVGQVPHKIWLLLRGVPVNQDIVCPGVAVGQDVPVPDWSFARFGPAHAAVEQSMPMMIETRLKDGRELTATCVIVSSSDRGAMIFTPCDRATRNFIAMAHDDAKKLFGNKSVILVPPRIIHDEQDQSWLPPVRLVAEFSSRPFNEKSCLSSAVVIWYQQKPYPFIGSDVSDDFASIDWEKGAKNSTLL
jgi:hypothetical protein